jgi:hypothetical protein
MLKETPFRQITEGDESMQSYLYIGGNQDSLNVLTPDDAKSVQVPLGVTGKETYTRSTLAVGDVSMTIYIHESLTSEDVINRLVGHYKAWAVNMPGGRRCITCPLSARASDCRRSRPEQVMGWLALARGLSSRKRRCNARSRHCTD